MAILMTIVGSGKLCSGSAVCSRRRASRIFPFGLIPVALGRRGDRGMHSRIGGRACRQLPICFMPLAWHPSLSLASQPLFFFVRPAVPTT